MPGARMWNGLFDGNWMATLNAVRPARRASSASSRASPGELAPSRGIEDVPEGAERVHAGRQRVEERLLCPRPEEVLWQERRQARERAVDLLHQHVGDEDLDLLGATVAGVKDAKVEVIRVGRHAWGTRI